jgi:hypothetical protein
VVVPDPTACHHPGHGDHRRVEVRVTSVAPTWLDDLEALPERAAPEADEVRLLDYPVALGIRQEERTIELVRELQLIALDARADQQVSSVHAGLIAFATAMSESYGPALSAPRAELERAHEAGEARTDIRYPLRPDSAAQMLTYARLMEEADAFCASGEVISLAPDTEVYALRRWTVEEFLRQYHGAVPRPWRPGLGRPGED